MLCSKSPGINILKDKKLKKTIKFTLTGFVGY